MIHIENGNFLCSVCKNSLTIYGEDGGKGIKTRCKFCKKTSYYPACKDCDQPTWRHDDEKHIAIVAKNSGMGYCTKCKKTKELVLFNIKDGKPSSRCKRCQADYFAEWYDKNKKEVESGITDEEVLDELFG